MNPHEEHRVPPPEELRCIWMTAGILTYRLCDREFDCDSCHLNSAMRRHPDRSDFSSDFGQRDAAAGKGLRNGYLYSRNHCWAKKVTESLVRVGLEPGLSQALLAPKAFVLPSNGQSIQRQQTCLWIVVEGGTLPFESPCTGIVHATNRRLVRYPHLALLQPFDDGWLFELEVEKSSLRLADFLDAQEAGSAYASDQERFQLMLSSVSRSRHLQVGFTMTDGGQRLQHIADIIGPGKYFSVLQKIFPP